MYSCADLSVSILVILESSLAAGKCFLSLSSALFKLCILLRSLSFALTRRTRLMKILSGSVPLTVLLLLSLIATCLAFSASSEEPRDASPIAVFTRGLPEVSAGRLRTVVGLLCVDCFESTEEGGCCCSEAELDDSRLDELELGDWAQNELDEGGEWAKGEGEQVLMMLDAPVQQS